MSLTSPNWKHGALALTMAALCCGAQATSADKFYAKAAPSIWRVFSFDAQGAAFSQGSAVVIAPETLLTNCHVIAKAKSFLIRQDNLSLGARLHYIDVERDMCQCVASKLLAPAVALGDSDAIAIGQKVFTIGNPIGLEQTLSDGLISALRKDGSQHLKFIQISAPISHGSSGGGLFDEEGKLIGITSAGIESGQNLNLAIPINWLRELPARSTAALEKYRAGENSGNVAKVAATSAGGAGQFVPIAVKSPTVPAPAAPSNAVAFLAATTPLPPASGFAGISYTRKHDGFVA